MQSRGNLGRVGSCHSRLLNGSGPRSVASAPYAVDRPDPPRAWGASGPSVLRAVVTAPPGSAVSPRELALALRGVAAQLEAAGAELRRTALALADGGPVVPAGADPWERRAAEIAWERGETLETLRVPDQGRTRLLARYDVARRLRAEGASALQIGRVLHRHHSTIVSLLHPTRKPAWRAKLEGDFRG